MHFSSFYDKTLHFLLFCFIIFLQVAQCDLLHSVYFVHFVHFLKSFRFLKQCFAHILAHAKMQHFIASKQNLQLGGSFMLIENMVQLCSFASELTLS